MTREERRQALHVLIDQHAEILRQLRLATAEITHINQGFEMAGQAIGRMAAAHDVAITAGLSVLDAALQLLDEERGVM